MNATVRRLAEEAGMDVTQTAIVPTGDTWECYGHQLEAFAKSLLELAAKECDREFANHRGARHCAIAIRALLK